VDQLNLEPETHPLLWRLFNSPFLHATLGSYSLNQCSVSQQVGRRQLLMGLQSSHFIKFYYKAV